MAPRRANVFTIAPGVPFLERFVEALLAGEIVAGFPDASDPLSLASTTILVPTQRAAQALRETFVAFRGAPAVVLPRIRTFGQLSEFDAEAPDEDDDAAFAVPPGVSMSERRLVLMRFVMQWAAALKHAPHTDEAERATAALVATAPAHAYRLAGDLAGLIDEMEIEGVPWERLRDVTPEEFDKYWKITLDFMQIATGAWAGHLVEKGLTDRVARQSLLIDAQIAQLQGGGGAPVIAIGSTGTNKSTARLLAALSQSPQGAVVLEPQGDLFTPRERREPQPAR